MQVGRKAEHLLVAVQVMVEIIMLLQLKTPIKNYLTLAIQSSNTPLRGMKVEHPSKKVS